jgi:hypothetical protein
VFWKRLANSRGKHMPSKVPADYSNKIGAGLYEVLMVASSRFIINPISLTSFQRWVYMIATLQFNLQGLPSVPDIILIEM